MMGIPFTKTFVMPLAKAPMLSAPYLTFPFLPISMFRDHVVKTGDWEAEKVFASSGNYRYDTFQASCFIT
jgi:hypothetical protein